MLDQGLLCLNITGFVRLGRPVLYCGEVLVKNLELVSVEMVTGQHLIFLQEIVNFLVPRRVHLVAFASTFAHVKFLIECVLKLKFGPQTRLFNRYDLLYRHGRLMDGLFVQPGNHILHVSFVVFGRSGTLLAHLLLEFALIFEENELKGYFGETFQCRTVSAREIETFPLLHILLINSSFSNRRVLAYCRWAFLETGQVRRLNLGRVLIIRLLHSEYTLELSSHWQHRSSLLLR